jgi:large conductance mechanosensitive channel
MKKIFSEFKTFIMRGNVLDLAVGVIIGSSFGAIITSLVKDILMPPIGVLLGNVDFVNIFLQLNPKKVPLVPGTTLAAAQEVGAVTWNYGVFINAIITFLIIALAVFFVVKLVNRMRRPKEEAPAEPTEKDCPFCCTKIPVNATRCPHCTSILE